MKNKLLWAVSIGAAVGIAQAVLGNCSFLERFIAAYGATITWHATLVWFVDEAIPDLMKDMTK